jgi:hypothetical protein
MANRTIIVDNNTWNNTHIATVGRAMSSPEAKVGTIGSGSGTAVYRHRAQGQVGTALSEGCTYQGMLVEPVGPDQMVYVVPASLLPSHARSCFPV